MSRNKRHDKLIVIDVESTCDDPRPSWQGEVIEVGVCFLDLRTLEITDQRGILVKPERTPITPFCTSLTTITPELIAREGKSLFEAMVILQEQYKIRERTWASWGDYDRNQLIKDCNSKKFGFPGERSSHINIKNVLAVECGWDRESGLDLALKRWNMKLEGTHHRGKDDAVNVARIYAAHIASIRENNPGNWVTANW
jgi:inhibitor of KinA sporulation pathway (predicted exonuclease)